MQQILGHLDLMSIKLTGLSLFLAAIVGADVAIFLAGLASVTTICYNMYRWFKEIKNKGK